MEIYGLFKKVVEKKWSDLHLCPGLPPMARTTSHFVPLEEVPLTHEAIERIIHELVPQHRWIEFTRGKETDISVNIEGLARFRANIYFDHNGICAAFRSIPQHLVALHTLGLPAAVCQTCDLQRGLVLVTGPTGSGKSTTLAAIIDKINQDRSCRIISLEDPIEYVHSHKRAIINQREIGTDTESFSSGLRAALREDPDVIMVGEMRDLDTIANAVTAAETGHLVFATLHTRDAVQSISRVIDVFPGDQQAQIRVQFAESIAVVVSQMLIPGRDGESRHLAAEVMVSSSAIKNLIRENKAHQIKNIIEACGKEGMLTMDQSIKFLLESRRIDIRAARKYAFEKNYFISSSS